MGRTLCALLICAAVVAAQEVKTIKGRLVDGDGNPVAGAVVSTTWLEGNATEPATSDAEGRFELPAKFYGNRPVAILAVHDGKGLGVVNRFSAAKAGKERELTMETLVDVKGTLFCEELDTKPPWTNVYINVLPGRVRVARFMSENAEFRFRLPPGDYQIHMYGTDVRAVTREQWVEGDEGAIDLGRVDLPATNLAKLYGRPAPAWNVTDARGLKQDTKLSDLKGKYVLIEFWGFW